MIEKANLMVRDHGRIRSLSTGAGELGQSLVEFALVAPLLLLLLFGALEGGLLVFTVGSARYAAGEAAQTAAELGNSVNTDSTVIQTIRSGPLGLTGLASISHIDIYRMVQQSPGTLTVDNTAYNSYKLDGTPISVSWPSGGRNVRNGQSDFLGLTISYHYTWATGSLLSSGPVQLSQSFYVRLEPQAY